MSAPVFPGLLDEAQSAEFFGVSKRTFLTLRAEPWMPAAKVLGPRLHRYSVDELRAAIANMPKAAARPQPESLQRARANALRSPSEVA